MSEVGLPPCSRCGSVAGVYRNRRFFGWGEEHYDVSGVRVELQIGEGLRATNTKTLRCEDCYQIRYDLVLRHGRVVVKER